MLCGRLFYVGLYSQIADKFKIREKEGKRGMEEKIKSI